MKGAWLLALLVLGAGCPRYRDGFLGADVAADGGGPDANADAGVPDDDDGDHEDFDDGDDAP